MINRDLLEKESQAINVYLDDNALSRFMVYAGALVGTNRSMNLTAITDPDEIVVKHFIDSLMILKYFDLDYSTKIIDIGSGAGFPGIPLLIAKDNKLDLTVLDSVKKKLRFVENALESCGLSAQTVCERAEVLSKDENYREQYDVAVARAVASMSALCEYCLPFVKVGGYFIALKGNEEEITSAKNAITTLGGEIENIVSYKLPNGDNRTMAIIKKISQTPTEYPRKSKKIATKPL